MRLLYGLGFRHIDLGVDKDEDKEDRLYICSIEGKRSDELKFSTHKEED